MTPDALQAVALAVAQERDLEAALRRVVRGLTDQPGVALARIWLVGPGDQCATCPLQAECPDRTGCLHLAASHGAPRTEGEDWSRTTGRFRRIPLGVRKVGRIGATGAPLLLELRRGRAVQAGGRPGFDPGAEGGARGAIDAAWARREGIRAFAGQPLVFRGEVLGVLAVFSRARLGEVELGWLRTFADQAAVALANGRAFEEIERLRRQLELENAYLREEVEVEQAAGELVGASLAIRKLQEQVRLVAPTRASVLILGESGTGKELVARAIHEHAGPGRRERPLIRVNCAAVPRDLFESEFFGHVKGAFTGALRDRVGRFELADGGTLLLDEVGEIPLELQGKLLRALQEGAFERVGDETTRAVDVRVVAATNRDLEADVAAGRFRQDLYFRLSVFPLVVPPLRERKDDIPLLARHLVQLACRRLGVTARPIAEADLRALCAHDWPGNVRELQNVIERGVILSRDGRLQLELPAARALAPRAREPRAGAGAEAEEVLTDAELRRRERDNLLAALRRTGWRVHGPRGAAALLGLKPTTLRSRMKAMAIARPV